MMTIELFISDEALAAERGRELADRVLRELTTGDGAPESTLAKARELTHVVVHRPHAWATGGPALEDAARYLVRLTVPGSWNSADFGAHVIPAISRVVAEFDGRADRFEHDPHCVVQIVGLREQNLGTLGRVMTGGDITRLITQDYREAGEAIQAPDGYVVDPVCGMAVEVATAKFTLTHDGVDYAFCAPGCRKVFVEDHAVAV